MILLSYDFLSAVNRSKIDDEIADIIKGARQSLDDIVQLTYVPCDVQPKKFQNFARRSQFSSAKETREVSTELSCATIERLVQLQRTALGTPHDGRTFMVCTTK